MFDYSFVISYLHLLFLEKETSLKNYYRNISLPWALAFSTIAPLLPLPPQNLLDHVSG